MRTRDELYNSLLKLQVDLSFSNEVSVLKKIDMDRVKNILDYGCGNGYFSKQLSLKYPNRNFYCCDRNAEILKFAKPFKGITFLSGEYPSITFPVKMDMVVLRHLTSYLSDRKNFFDWIRNNCNDGAYLLLIDAYDENLLIEPTLPEFNKGLEKFYSSVDNMGGDRDIFSDTKHELADLGYTLIDSLKIIVNSDTPNLKEKIFVYMNLVAELDNGLPLSEGIREELMDWVTNESSYMQYGLFASVFKLKK